MESKNDIMILRTRDKIEQIRHGNVPEGYKKTKAGILPADWNVYILGDCLRRIERPVEVNPNELYTQIGIRSHGKGLFYKEPVTGEALGNKSVFWIEPNCFILNIVFAWEQAIGKTTQAEVGMIGSHRFPMYRPINDAVDIDYLISYFLTKRGTDILEAASPGGAGRNKTLGQDRFLKSKIVLPPFKEQQKIAAILTAQDKIVELKENLLTEKQQQKKYLMQQLLTGKRRLPGFSGKWKSIKIGDFIKEIDERTTCNNQFKILSVTRNGIVHQSVHFNKQIASEDNTGYKVLRKGNLAFSTMNLWMGSLDVLTICDVGIISSAYKVFEFNKDLITIDFAINYMKSAEMIWLYKMNSEQGASIVRRNLDLHALLSSKVSLPDLPEQTAIAEVLSTADRELDLLRQDIEQEKRKKKALMQLLLTGIVRVNV